MPSLEDSFCLSDIAKYIAIRLAERSGLPQQLLSFVEYVGVL